MASYNSEVCLGAEVFFVGGRHGFSAVDHSEIVVVVVQQGYRTQLGLLDDIPDRT